MENHCQFNNNREASKSVNESKKEKAAAATEITTSIIIADNWKRTTPHSIAINTREKLPMRSKHSHMSIGRTRNNETENSLFFSLLLFVISRRLFALCSASFVRLLPFGLIDTFFLYFILFFFCRRRCCWFFSDRNSSACVCVYCLMFVSVLFTWFLMASFYERVRLYVWNWWWLWHGHQITIITVQIDVTMCFRLNGICCGTKCVNFNKSTRTHLNINEQTSTSDGNFHQQRFWHIFIRTHTFFCHRCPSPWTCSNACIARPQCVCAYVCVFWFFFFASIHLAYRLLIVHHSNKNKSGLCVFHGF